MHQRGDRLVGVVDLRRHARRRVRGDHEWLAADVHVPLDLVEPVAEPERRVSERLAQSLLRLAQRQLVGRLDDQPQDPAPHEPHPEQADEERERHCSEGNEDEPVEDLRGVRADPSGHEHRPDQDERHG